MNPRRRLLVVLAATAFAPRAAFAQSKQPVLIGWLSTGSRDTHGQYFAAFKEGAAALGWKDGTHLIFEERWAGGRYEHLPAMAGEIAEKGPAVIVASAGSAATAATKAAPKTPIVYIGGDPIGTGLVTSLARPDGMVTGFAYMTPTISEKYVELLLDAVPKLRRIGVLIDATSSNRGLHTANVRRAAAQYSVDARYAEAPHMDEIEPALSRLAKERVQALVVTPGQAALVARQRIMKFALAQRWPVIGEQREFAEEGALLSYGVNHPANFRRAAYYLDRILKGTKPADLPIEQATTFELVVNMKTAKLLGLKIPNSILLRADKLIE